MNKRAMLMGAVVVGLVVAFALGARLYERRRAEHLDFVAGKSFATFVPEHAPVLGPPGAQVHLIEFADPACETCAAFSPVVKRLLRTHDGRLKLVVRCLPLHQGSETMCRILEAAKRQGKYWQALDTMFASQRAWASHHDPRPERIWGFLEAAGLDVAALERDVGDPVIAGFVARDVADARALGITKTPGFFVNGRPLARFGSRELEDLVAEEVAARYGR